MADKLSIVTEKRVEVVEDTKEYDLPLCLKKVDFNNDMLEYIYVDKNLVATILTFEHNNTYALIERDFYSDEVHGNLIRKCDKRCSIEEFNDLLDKAIKMVPKAGEEDAVSTD